MRSQTAPTQQIERQLVAILAADIAGYSRLMGADEEGTLARLRTCRRGLIEPCIARHHGRIVKTTGDGLLVESHNPTGPSTATTLMLNEPKCHPSSRSIL